MSMYPVVEGVFFSLNRKGLEQHPSHFFFYKRLSSLLPVFQFVTKTHSHLNRLDTYLNAHRAHINKKKRSVRQCVLRVAMVSYSQKTKNPPLITQWGVPSDQLHVCQQPNNVVIVGPGSGTKERVLPLLYKRHSLKFIKIFQNSSNSKLFTTLQYFFKTLQIYIYLFLNSG